MKLKRVYKSVRCDYKAPLVAEDDMYSHCLYCKYYQDGVCTNTDLAYDLGFYIEQPSEEGKVREAVIEGLEDHNEFDQLIWALRELKVSKKNIEYLTEKFRECFNAYKDNVEDNIEDNVTRVYENFLNEALKEGVNVAIKDPARFWCNHFE